MLLQFVEFVGELAPELYKDVKDLVSQFTTQHPALAAPPPADGESKVNAEVDQEMQKQFTSPGVTGG
jgi:hypothetical protein